MKKVTKIILIICATLIVLGLAAGLFAWNYYKKGIAPVSDKSKEIIVTVENGQSATSVLYTLEKAGLVKDVFCGKVYLKLNDVGNLQANSYILNQNMSLEQIFKIMANPTGDHVVQFSVTILDGYSLKEISGSIAEVLKIEATEVMDLLNDESFLKSLIEKYWFITDEILQEGIKYPLEGYLYPETYLYNSNVTLKDVIYGSLDMMDKYLTEAKDTFEARGWTAHEFLTFASIVERESLFDEDRPKIAGVFMNRLEANMLLQSDITVNYAWDRTGVDVLYKHLEIDSPYNTYKYDGLPIGPISTVSGVTMDACVNYEENEFYYFFAKQDGTVIYNRNLSEHNSAVKNNKWY
ncbi:MAG: endolytic transglycosylase MltG [Agathobacter sp.]|nr:endolytic transglycosylase MltG [Tyzzerella sp.]MBQ6844773.1 endolytic transglycosylase MltG [Agathobacter sp.]